MVDIRPFRGVRYNAARFGQDISSLICPPYDVISAAENASLLGRSPSNMIRLEGPSQDPGADPANKYRAAAERFGAWLAEGVLRAEDTPAIYAYAHEFVQDGQSRVRRGLMVELRLAPWNENVVRPHERTHDGPKEDRLALIQACRANFSPIWCLYQDGNGATGRLWSGIDQRDPDVSAVDDDGVIHKLWVITDQTVIGDLRDSLAAGPAYIADGHHRYETAVHYRDQMRAEGGLAAEPDAGSNFALTYLVEGSDPGLIVLGTHRVVAGSACGHIDRASLRGVLADHFGFTEIDGDPAAVLAALEADFGAPAFGIFAPEFGTIGVARLKDGDAVPEAAVADHSLAWRKLDLAALHGLAIDRLLPQRSAALFAAGQLEYTRDLAEVERLARSDTRSIAFLVRTTPVEQVMAVADARDRMPEKSTYFYPKPASGLVIARCDELLPPVES